MLASSYILTEFWPKGDDGRPLSLLQHCYGNAATAR
jgi:hypothetical protein